VLCWLRSSLRPAAWQQVSDFVLQKLLLLQKLLRVSLSHAPHAAPDDLCVCCDGHFLHAAAGC
jgi:hypothetical protein